MSIEFALSQARPSTAAVGAVIVGLYEDRSLCPAAQELDQAAGGRIKALVDAEDISGKAGKVSLLHRLDGIASPRVLVVGLGDRGKFDGFAFQKALRAAVAAVRETPAADAFLALVDLDVKSRDRAWAVAQAVQLGAAGMYQYSATKKPRNFALKRIDLPGREGDDAAIAHARSISAGIDFAKELANLPPNLCTPAHMAAQAQALANELDGVTCDILDETQMDALGMGSLLAVARGSANRPRLIVLNWRGGNDGDAPYVLVGKGITFDTGGISLKPGAGMEEMKYDMCGAATVLGAFNAVARARLPVNLTVVAAAVENMPDGASYRPSDVLTSMSGKTIEVLNTDAEGRLILCDALTYAQQTFKPKVLIDCATLTGACVVALGKYPHGLFTADDELARDLLDAGDHALDRAWRMPLWSDYQDQLDSVVADMANLGGKWGGAITAACFLWRFTEGQRWAHLDIAGTAWDEGRKGLATGRPVPLLVEYLSRQAQA
ncbi:leucyl aminopeptidase [Pseudofulvimonas gallinarii]|jgi:leucyl aminopeptidase|uniref:Probable cytosol aminopeptidase n=1 Tax=Pseudofulvimonas gallinarii TaxID=634155 RepID=A0A4R3LQL7_9GAMM|nr:leucyl aminopeptidase [Pseudofulvimonas gallinarii]TCT00357.1 aminopeptidase A [Pseudofulvimonas gallinarii]THD14195.1 leucyl aminopeptidase [Pseudofulvimonas gallinarii]